MRRTSILFALCALLAACGDNVGPDRIALDPEALSLPAGLRATVAAEYRYGATVLTGETIQWSSSDEEVAEVADGQVHALRVGTATVTAEGEGLTATLDLTVTAALVTALEITPPTPSLADGTTLQLAATAIYTDDSTADVTADATWSSDDEDVATVDAGAVAGHAPGDVAIAAAFGGAEDAAAVTITDAVLTEIDVTPVEPSTPLGIDVPMTATGIFSDATTQDLTAQVAWSSADTDTVTVSPAGLAHPVAVGSAAIEASLDGVTGSTDVTVDPAVLQSITVTPDDPTIPLGIDPQFTATGHYSDGTNPNITASVTWSSTATLIATISDTAGTKGAAITLDLGTTTIRAQLGAIFDTSMMTVSDATLESIDVTPLDPDVPLGLEPEFVATGHYSDASTLVITDQVLWESEHEDVATISNASTTWGLATTHALGTTAITATRDGKVGTSDLHVIDAALETIEVLPADSHVALGIDPDFTATGHYTDGTTAPLTDQALWESTDEDVAQISNASGTEGHATTLEQGSTTIRATFDGVEGTTPLTVDPPDLVSITVSPDGLDLAAGVEQQFVATGLYTDGSMPAITALVTWASTDEHAAVISNAAGSNGLATALAQGATTVSATLGARSDTTLVTTHLEVVTGWDAVPELAGLQTCPDGVKFSVAPEAVYVCTTTSGVRKGTITGTTIAWANASAGLTGLALNGAAIQTHPVSATMLVYLPQVGSTNNWFRNTDALVTMPWSGSTLANDSAGQPRTLFTHRFQPGLGGGGGNMDGTWDSGTGGHAQIITGANPPANVRTVSTATGSVVSLAGSSATDLYAGVLGGATATGGVYHSIDGSAATWTKVDAFATEGDDLRVVSVVIDPTDATVLYGGLKGGALIYKGAVTTAGAPPVTTWTWTASAGTATSHIPAAAQVTLLYISPVDHNTIFAGTTLGLYKSTDAGATWALAGFRGRSIRAIGQSAVASSIVVVGVADAAGMYKAQ